MIQKIGNISQLLQQRRWGIMFRQAFTGESLQKYQHERGNLSQNRGWNQNSKLDQSRKSNQGQEQE